MCFAKGIALSVPYKRAKVPSGISQNTLVHPSLFFSEVESEREKTAFYDLGFGWDKG